MPPLLWKKAKAGKLARLVCDLGRKRSRSPLVVQTGFPTSLADIIVKNSSRLKKPSPKNAASDPSSSAASTDSQGQIPDSAPPDVGRRLVETGQASPARPVLARDAGVDENVENVGVTGSACFTAIAKVFIVVVLALGTKELAVAITASALVLFILEFIGKRWVFPPKPTNPPALALNSAVRDGRNGEARELLDVRSLDVPGTDLQHSGARITDGVVSVTNAPVTTCSEIRAVESDLGLLRKQRSFESPQVVWRSVASPSSKDDPCLAGGKKKRAQKSGSKKFMQFLKKLRGKKHGKRHKRSSDEIPNCKGDECEEEEGQGYEDEEIFSSESSSNDLMEEEEEDDEVEDVAEESSCRMIQLKTGHVVLLDIILLGLIGGRGVALALTLSSLLVVEAVQHIWDWLKMRPANNTSCG